MRPSFTPFERAYDEYDPLLTYIRHDVVLIWNPPSAFPQYTLSPFTVDLIEYNYVEQFIIASKARVFENDTALSAILAPDDRRYKNHLGCHVCHFECEVVVLQGNLTKFPQNDEMRVALENTVARHVVEATPYDNVCRIGLRASDSRVASPT